MAKGVNIEKLIEQAVSHALDAQLPQIKLALATQVAQELSSHVPQEKGGKTPGAGAAGLLKAVSAVHAGTTQKEILRALLEETQHYSVRAALFVVKGGVAGGWQGRGFANSDHIKDFSLDVNSGPAAEALHSRIAVTGNASEMDTEFISQFGAPADGNVIALPLLLKEKVAALVYADAGAEAGGHLDASALELLVAATSSWLEAVSSRKQSQKESRDQEPNAVSEAPAVQSVSSYADPFAGHSPAFSSAAQPAPVAVAASAAAGAGSTSHLSGRAAATQAMSAEDAETHQKAQRFARLLVDEIKLYNQAKVTEGRKNRDVYDRLKEDIEKSRSMYLKRYGATVAASADYFSGEVVRSLAEDDTSLMGPNFKR